MLINNILLCSNFLYIILLQVTTHVVTYAKQVTTHASPLNTGNTSVFNKNKVTTC